MSEPMPREIWRAAYERFTTAPRGTEWSELVRLAAIEKEAWRALRESQRTEKKEGAHERAE